MFKQKFENGRQTEVADNWRTAAESWLIPRHEDEVEVRFGGQISPSWDSLGHYHAEHTGYTAVIALPRDMLIAGYGSEGDQHPASLGRYEPELSGHVPLLRGRVRQEP